MEAHVVNIYEVKTQALAESNGSLPPG